MQSCVVKYKHGVKWSHIGDFIEQTFTTSQRNDRYLWVALDAIQSARYVDDHPLDLFTSHDGSTRSYQIPIITLLHVLRNTEEITQVVSEQRSETISVLQGIDTPTSHALPSIECAHNITSQKVCCHRLQVDEQK